MIDKKAEEAFTIGMDAEEAGDFQKAQRSYQAAVKLDPRATHARLRLAGLLFEQSKFKEAICVARQITKRWPRVSLAHCLIARSYAELGRWAFAERFYRQALAIKQTPAVWVLLADALNHRGQEYEAINCLRKALEVDADFEEAHYNLGVYFFRFKGKWALAEKHLRRAIEIDPKYAVAYSELGQLLLRLKGKKKEAARLLRKAVDYNPDDPWSRAFLANTLWALRKLKAAKEQYLTLIKRWPEESKHYKWYADFLLHESGNQTAAKKYLKSAAG